jgi:hypothetical protein
MAAVDVFNLDLDRRLTFSGISMGAILQKYTTVQTYYGENENENKNKESKKKAASFRVDPKCQCQSEWHTQVLSNAMGTRSMQKKKM